MGLPAVSADYLFIGPLVVARLSEVVVDLPVEHIETVQQVLAADMRNMVAKVMWAGDRFDSGEQGRGRGGDSQLVHQRWLVALAVNNPAPDPAARNSQVGPWLSKVHAALAGWAPPGAGGRSMRRAQAAIAPTFTSTQAVYPLGFEITLAL